MEPQISCPSCNQTLASDSTLSGREVECPLCKNPFIMPQANPPPVARVVQQAAVVTKQPTSVSLWNPTAAINWSVLFGPIFGTFLHYKNWVALGNPKQAGKAMYGLIAAILLQAYLLNSTLTLNSGEPPLSIGATIVFLVLWYYGQAKGQVNVVRESYGSDYNKRDWTLPLGIAAACVGLLLTSPKFVAGANRQKIQAMAVDMVHQNMKKMGVTNLLENGIHCTSVEIVEEVYPGHFKAEALMSSGAKLNIVIDKANDAMSVELPYREVLTKLLKVDPDDTGK